MMSLMIFRTAHLSVDDTQAFYIRSAKKGQERNRLIYQA